MLVLIRKINEKILIGNDALISVRVLGIKGNQIKLGIEAPRHIVIDREEITLLKQQQERRNGNVEKD